ncbi:hypothetical protein AHiyo1_01590 [Arthrobacter sp. Hiyo1]|nr:hypothetical protein AHiyo1_01590 [Arthrobacter sp. Hiyo1]
MQCETIPYKPAGKTTLFPGLELWNEVTQRITNHSGYDLVVVSRLIEEKYEVHRFTVLQRPGGPAVTGIALRDFSLPTIVRTTLGRGTDLDSESDPAFGLIGVEEARAIRDAGPTRHSLEAVAKVYRTAHAVQAPPTKSVQETFAIPARTAGAWIAKARDLGLIPSQRQDTKEAWASDYFRNLLDHLGQGRPDESWASFSGVLEDSIKHLPPERAESMRLCSKLSVTIFKMNPRRPPTTPSKISLDTFHPKGPSP